MNPQNAAVFKVIDDYVRLEHRCFVSECDQNTSRAEWVICLRPTVDNTRPLDRYACKYFRLTQQEADELCKSNGLSPALKAKIDIDLQAITDGAS
jgi:hypothetical protein